MENKIKIFSDGGALGNPGTAASAFVVYQDGKIIHQFYKKIGNTTNNVAEYQAVIIALEWLLKQSTLRPELRARAIKHPLRQSFSEARQQSTINFFLDSELVVRQLNGIYKIKDGKMKLLVLRIKSLEQELGAKIIYSHVRRTENTLADSLVKKALNV
ncbi:MAG: ribonuclease HI family protein [bacterium]|nr:ribonuclease HI family protein [bacterium]